MLRKFLFMLVAIAMAMATSLGPASAQTYPVGPTIGASVTSDGAVLLNVGDFAGDIFLAIDGVVEYTGPASGASVANLNVSPGAQLTITGMDASGATLRSTTTVMAVTIAQVSTPVPAPSPVPATAPVPALAPVSQPVFVVAPAPAPVAAVVAATHSSTAAKKSPALAVTGSSANIPVLLGTSLLAAGGLALLAGRKREAQAL